MQHIISQIKEQFAESAKLKKEFVKKYAKDIFEISQKLIACLKNGGKILVCGNGGSAADSQHFAGEMICRLCRDRAPIPAIALSTDTSVITAIGNDYSMDDIFSRQVDALGRENDILMAISTSGNSQNVIKAVQSAQKLGIPSIALLGKDGGKLLNMVNSALVVPSESSQRIQEIHITIIHTLCQLVENNLYPQK